MNTSFKNVIAYLNANNTTSLKCELSALITQENVILNSPEVIDALLNYNDNDIVLLTVKLTAECAKLESNRLLLTKPNIIRSLLKLFKGKTDEIYQSVRALGNICYENEDGCNHVGEEGLKSVLNILRNCESYPETLNTGACGLLLNMLTCSQHLRTLSCKCDLLQLVEKLLLMNRKTDSAIVKHLLSILNVVNEEMEEIKDIYTVGLYSTVIDVMKATTDPEVNILCLEVFQSHYENSKCSAYKIFKKKKL